ncbi:unnamed protein product [Diatraea saccharalis]|uniref:E3 ubiquitin-protein ligase n=1 Tax=Diatraea saccharalis TaxID=40085 RepID=A0A9N9RCB0_9NEOP|nr:unnamed protein product [Diatraea saccharalis]
MCRAEIPSDYLDHPILLEKLSSQESAIENINKDFQWYYQGRNGWWKYDERSNEELEVAFNSGETNFTLLLAGALYSIDFQTMMQVRSNDPTRRRHIRRDIPTLPAKGVAGIKIFENTQTEQTKRNTEDDLNEVEVISSHSEDEVIEIEDDDESDVVPDESTNSNSSIDINSYFSSLNLADPETSRDLPNVEDT